MSRPHPGGPSMRPDCTPGNDRLTIDEGGGIVKRYIRRRYNRMRTSLAIIPPWNPSLLVARAVVAPSFIIVAAVEGLSVDRAGEGEASTQSAFSCGVFFGHQAPPTLLDTARRCRLRPWRVQAAAACTQLCTGSALPLM